MAGTFMGLGIAVSGLFANQRAINVTSHNVSNANTEGYSRQRMDMQAYRPDELPGKLGTLGVGTDVTAVKQIRDQFLDFKYRTENSKLSEWKSKFEVLKNVESILNEPSDSSIGRLMDDFFNSLQEVSKNAESLSVRTLLRERGMALVKGMSSMATGLKKLQADLNFEFQTAVKDVNKYAEEIKDLNKVIFETEIDGGFANDARDQRNLLIDKLSKYTSVDVYQDNEDRFHVSVNGHILVSHYRADKLKIQKRDERKNPDDVDGLCDVRWKDGSQFITASGNIKGLLDVRDNIDGNDKGVPYYLDKLNVFMDRVVSEMNRIHKQGYDLKGEKGINFFTINGMKSNEFDEYLLTSGLDGKAAVDITNIITDFVNDKKSTNPNMDKHEEAGFISEAIGGYIKNNPQYKNKSIHTINGRYYVVDRLTADKINMAPELSDATRFAASEFQSKIPRNGQNILYMADIRHNVDLYDWGSADDYVKSLVSNLGVNGDAAKNLKDNQKLLVNQINIKRESVMGVSLDEEMSNVIRFQHAYSANARMINTIDEMVDLVVNRLGLVGR